jgi:hypothetical protein
VSEPKRFRGSLLVIVGLALVALTVVVLISMRRPRPRDDEGSAAGVTAQASEQQQQQQARSLLPRPLPRPPLPGTAPVSPGSDDTPLPSPTHRIEAPPVIPPEVANERDPAKKAELLRMHRLTTARVRASMLRRRQDLLTRSIEDARKGGSWSAGKLRDAEKQLTEISNAVVKAEERLEQVRREVGGDIDLGKKK